MAKTIDLRHLVEKEPDPVLFTGSDDRKDYTVYTRKTVEATLRLQQYMNDFSETRKNGEYTAADSIEIGYLTLLAWFKDYYPDMDIDWLKKNLSQPLFEAIMLIANEMFFPKAEEGRPRKNPKKRRS